MDAVKCIVNKSEEYALEFHENQMLRENFTYYSSKFSPVSCLKLYTSGNLGELCSLLGQRLESDERGADQEPGDVDGQLHGNVL
jgi:hypothetical protein